MWHDALMLPLPVPPLQQLTPGHALPRLQLYFWDYTQRDEPCAALRLRRAQQAPAAAQPVQPGGWRLIQPAAAAAAPSSTAPLSRLAPSTAPALLAGPSQLRDVASDTDSGGPQHAQLGGMPELASLPQRHAIPGRQQQQQQARPARSSHHPSQPYLIKSKKSFRAVLTDPVGRGLLYTAGEGLRAPGCMLHVMAGPAGSMCAAQQTTWPVPDLHTGLVQ